MKHLAVPMRFLAAILFLAAVPAVAQTTNPCAPPCTSVALPPAWAAVQSDYQAIQADATALAAAQAKLTADMATLSTDLATAAAEAIVLPAQAPTLAPTPAVSPDGTQVAAGSSGTIVNALGTWAFDNAATRYDGTRVTLNGKPSGSGTDYGSLLYIRAGVIYLRDISQWWKWDSTTGDFVGDGGTATTPAPP